MDSVLVRDFACRLDELQRVISASITAGGTTYKIRYLFLQGLAEVADVANALLPVGLFAAMRLSCPLEIEGVVSPRLYQATQKIQEIFHTWYPEFEPVRIEADAIISTDNKEPQEVGAFFSGGVDSFYTLLKHHDEITKIIFVHGFDIRLDNVRLRC